MLEVGLVPCLAGRAVEPVQHSLRPIGQDIEDSARIDADVTESSKSMLYEMILDESAALAECQAQSRRRAC
jgi:hypothetical protein